VNRHASLAITMSLLPWAPLHAQDLTIDELKGKIFDAHMAQKTFAGGLQFCGELDGTTFYFQPRNRVLKLADYHRSLDDLVRARAFNPATRRPWNPQDASERWEQVQRQALQDKENCALVASLGELEKRLKEMEGIKEGARKRD